ncbi:hypothetical protein DSO57_1037721 [Entomophthora muscae]|uniref:Uncharacterized protein n=1 Tax=Entomophthora muscae TaxID=34485 RepID=A0ACC2TAR5_9FUNG|nr:hypothetical protein DSO57_1037721 [Entomophthora muscae]
MIKLITLVAAMASTIFGLPTPSRPFATIVAMKEPIAISPASTADLISRPTPMTFDMPFEVIQDKIISAQVEPAQESSAEDEPSSELAETTEKSQVKVKSSPQKLRRRSRPSKKLRRRSPARKLRRHSLRPLRRRSRRSSTPLRRRSSRSPSRSIHRRSYSVRPLSRRARYMY